MLSCARFAKALFLAVAFSSVLLLLVPSSLKADSTLISVVFTSVNEYGSGGPGDISGPESTATAQNPLFGAANVWNNLSSAFGVLTTNPSWTNLVDSNGNATGVELSIVGTVQPVNVYPYNPGFYAGNPLRSYYLAWNSNGPGGESDSITWALSGLAPNATYDMCAYGPVTGQNVSFNMTIGSNTQAVQTYADFSSLGCTYFRISPPTPWVSSPAPARASAVTVVTPTKPIGPAFNSLKSRLRFRNPRPSYCSSVDCSRLSL